MSRQRPEYVDFGSLWESAAVREEGAPGWQRVGKIALAAVAGLELFAAGRAFHAYDYADRTLHQAYYSINHSLSNNPKPARLPEPSPTPTPDVIYETSPQPVPTWHEPQRYLPPKDPVARKAWKENLQRSYYLFDFYATHGYLPGQAHLRARHHAHHRRHR